MSDNEKPLDLGPIEECWNKSFPDVKINTPSIGSLGKGASMGYDYVLGEDYESILAPECEKFAFNAPMFVSELVAEVKRLRGFEYHMRQIGYPIDDNAYNCLICDELTSSVVEMLRHMKVQHQPKE